MTYVEHTTTGATSTYTIPTYGYTCSMCGQWVQTGTWHQCSGMSTGVHWYPTYRCEHCLCIPVTRAEMNREQASDRQVTRSHKKCHKCGELRLP